MEQGQTNEGKPPFPLTAEARSPTKSKDQLDCQFDADWSLMRSGRAGREMHCYVVRNLTKGGQYTVEFFEDDHGLPHGFCNCAASVICKHLKAALEDLLVRDPEFGELHLTREENNDEQPR